MLRDEAAELFIYALTDRSFRTVLFGLQENMEKVPARKGNKPPSSSVKTSEELQLYKDPLSERSS